MKEFTLSPGDLARCHQIASGHKSRIRAIVEQVGIQTGVPVAHILGRRRDKRTANARQLAMYVCVKAGFSRPAIGAEFNRDQSTVTHGYQAELARRKVLQSAGYGLKMDGPGGVTSAHPGPDHRQSERETANHG